MAPVCLPKCAEEMPQLQKLLVLLVLGQLIGLELIGLGGVAGMGGAGSLRLGRAVVGVGARRLPDLDDAF